MTKFFWIIWCFSLLVSCNNKTVDGDRYHDLIIGKEHISVQAKRDTINVRTRYSDFILTRIDLIINKTIVSTMKYHYLTVDSIYYELESNNQVVEKIFSIQDTIKFEGIEIYRKKKGLSLILDENQTPTPHQYTLQLDGISNYGYVYIKQQAGVVSQ